MQRGEFFVGSPGSPVIEEEEDEEQEVPESFYPYQIETYRENESIAEYARDHKDELEKFNLWATTQNLHYIRWINTPKATPYTFFKTYFGTSSQNEFKQSEFKQDEQVILTIFKQLIPFYYFLRQLLRKIIFAELSRGLYANTSNYADRLAKLDMTLNDLVDSQLDKIKQQADVVAAATREIKTSSSAPLLDKKVDRQQPKAPSPEPVSPSDRNGALPLRRSLSDGALPQKPMYYGSASFLNFRGAYQVGGPTLHRTETTEKTRKLTHSGK